MVFLIVFFEGRFPEAESLRVIIVVFLMIRTSERDDSIYLSQNIIIFILFLLGRASSLIHEGGRPISFIILLL